MKIISHRKSLVPFGISRTGKIASYPPHRHDFVELTYIHSGTGVHVLGGVSSAFKANEVLFVPPSVEHSFIPAGTHDQTSIAFYPEFFSAQSVPLAADLLAAILKTGRSAFSLLPAQIPDFERMVEAIFREYMFKEPGYEKMIALECAGLLQAVLRSQAKKKTEVSRFKGLPPPLYAALVRIESEYHLLGESGELSSGAEVSGKQLIRLFNKHLRLTPLQYLNRVRIEKCCELLSVKDLAITDAAYRTGFNDLANFNRLFKRFTGMTPSSFRSALALGRVDPANVSRFAFPIKKN